ncbi:MAG: hypothetical protein E7586_01265 [Ruminococcaceae bacterium]|nr:hypothetical protein [Oscillospiraceae bacterium]
MGKRKKYRFPQGINGLDGIFRHNLHPHPQANAIGLNGTRYFDISSQNYQNDMYSDTDPFGQYTGLPKDGGVPLQDADDL